MAVRFIKPGFLGEDGSAMGPCTLYGEPFPSEELQALWHMWPDRITIHWVPGLSQFVVYNTTYGTEGMLTAEAAKDVEQWRQRFMSLRAFKNENGDGGWHHVE